MQNAKSGLRLLTLSIILYPIWALVLFIVTAVNNNSALVNYNGLITAIVSILCFVIQLIGLFKAGKDNARFHTAGKLVIGQIGLSVVSLIVAIVGAAAPSTAKVMGIIVTVIEILVLLMNVLVLTNVIKGCKEIAPRVRGLANFTYGAFVCEVLFAIVLEILALPSITISDALAVVILIVGLFMVLLLIAFAICYILLIFRTTANVGKPRK